MKYRRALAAGLLLAGFVSAAHGQKPEYLTDEEQDKLREAQEPSERIQLYLEFEQVRLERFETGRSNPAVTTEDIGKYLDDAIVQFVGLDEELKNWVEDQYGRGADMRKGLHALLETGAKQLEQLRRIQQAPDANVRAYADSLRDAIEDLTDTLDGATKALGEQEKKFAALKQQEKTDARDSKLRAKEEKKRTKEEQKLRKKEHKSGVPADSDQN
jgi:hypothetical protein